MQRRRSRLNRPVVRLTDRGLAGCGVDSRDAAVRTSADSNVWLGGWRAARSVDRPVSDTETARTNQLPGRARHVPVRRAREGLRGVNDGESERCCDLAILRQEHVQGVHSDRTSKPLLSGTDRRRVADAEDPRPCSSIARANCGSTRGAERYRRPHGAHKMPTEGSLTLVRDHVLPTVNPLVNGLIGQQARRSG